MRYIFLFVMCLLLTGCSYAAPQNENHPVRVVVQIDVTASEDGQITHYRYTHPEKLSAVLYYLRLVEPDLSAVITPETFRTDAYRITLHLSDGTQTVYHQLHSEYLQMGNGAWRKIDSARGGALVRILKELPPDA